MIDKIIHYLDYICPNIHYGLHKSRYLHEPNVWHTMYDIYLNRYLDEEQPIHIHVTKEKETKWIFDICLVDKNLVERRQTTESLKDVLKVIKTFALFVTVERNLYNVFEDYNFTNKKGE